MRQDDHINSTETPTISPLAAEPTYGERRFHFIFNVLINFWLNLTTSALFTYWVSHAQKPMFGLKKSPAELQKAFGEFAYKLAPMRVFGEKGTFDPESATCKRSKAAMNAANAFTLVMAGHPIMIGSVWLGAKVKAPIVKFFNRRHYGDAAMESDELKARHLAIEAEERPTLFGAIVGRISTIFATQLTAYAVGNPTNLVGWAGERFGIHFKGLDHLSGVAGTHLGNAVQELAPQATGKIDASLRRDGRFNWSVPQMAANPALRNTAYHGFAQHFGKYLAQDVLYTAVTAGSINPALNVLKHYIPGMTYRPDLPGNREITGQKLGEELGVKPARLADNAGEARHAPDAADAPHQPRAQPHAQADKPSARVHHVRHEASLHVGHRMAQGGVV